MAADASIYSLLRPVQGVADPLEQAGKALSIQHLIGQGDLNALQLAKAKRDMATEEQVSNAIRQSSGDPEAIRRAYQQAGDIKGLQAFEKGQLDTANTRSQIDERQWKQFKDRADMVSAAFASQAQNPSHEGLITTLDQLRQRGALDQKGYEQYMRSIPSDPSQLPQFTQRLAMASEQGRKALEMLAPKLEKFTNGQQTFMGNVNTLAGPTQQPFQMQATPDAVMSNERQISEGKLNRGNSMAIANMADARAREAAARAGQHYDAERGVIVDTQTGATRPVMTPEGKPQGQKALPPQQAAQASLLIQGRQDVQRARDLIFDKDGKVNRGTLFQAQNFGVPGVTALQVGGIPFTEGRDLKSYIMNAVEGKLRLESGAAVPEQEVIRIAQRFVPSLNDSDKTIKQKLDRLDEFMAESLALTKLPAGTPAAAKAPIAVPGQKSSGKIQFLGFE